MLDLPFFVSGCWGSSEVCSRANKKGKSVIPKHSHFGIKCFRLKMSENISEHQFTILLPWTEVKCRDFIALGVTRSSGAILEGSFGYIGDTSVVTDDAGK